MNTMKILTEEEWKGHNLSDSYEYSRFLTALLTHFQHKEALEIGIGPAISTILFLTYLPDSTLMTLDCQELPGERHRFRQIGKDRVKDFIMSSDRIPTSEIAKKTFDYIYIDGDHRYWGCLGDAENCHPLLRKNGLMVFDDGHMEDVKKAVDDFLEKYHDFYAEIEPSFLGVTNDHRARVLERIK